VLVFFAVYIIQYKGLSTNNSYVWSQLWNQSFESWLFNEVKWMHVFHNAVYNQL
ncbi:hypothetical protein QYM36_018563, partial [Artemia franciscana]